MQLFQSPLHPGVNVGVDFIAWGALVALGIITAFAVITDYPDHSCDDLDDAACHELGSRLSAVERTGVVVTLLNG